jgi:hypothetical protein
MLNRRPCRTQTDFQTARDDSTNDAWLSQTVDGPWPGQPPHPALISYFYGEMQGSEKIQTARCIELMRGLDFFADAAGRRF